MRSDCFLRQKSDAIVVQPIAPDARKPHPNPQEKNDRILRIPDVQTAHFTYRPAVFYHAVITYTIILPTKNGRLCLARGSIPLAAIIAIFEIINIAERIRIATPQMTALIAKKFLTHHSASSFLAKDEACL